MIQRRAARWVKNDYFTYNSVSIFNYIFSHALVIDISEQMIVLFDWL